MNREYAIEILDMIERGTADRNWSLAKEAVNYLLRLKGTYKDSELMRRIESIKHGHRAK